MLNLLVLFLFFILMSNCWWHLLLKFWCKIDIILFISLELLIIMGRMRWTVLAKASRMSFIIELIANLWKVGFSIFQKTDLLLISIWTRIIVILWFIGVVMRCILLSIMLKCFFNYHLVVNIIKVCSLFGAS